MSIAIIGGNDCMVCRYKDICKKYKCKAKVFTHINGIKNQIGSPDMIIFFTNTLSHKMMECANNATRGKDIKVVHSKSSSKNALINILEEHVAKAS